MNEPVTGMSKTTGQGNANDIDSATPSSSDEVIVLPIGYGATSWKVKHRSIVRKGETIAIVYPRKEEGEESTIASLPSSGTSTKHLRPSVSSAFPKKPLDPATNITTTSEKKAAVTTNSNRSSSSSGGGNLTEANDGQNILATTDGFVNIYNICRIDPNNSQRRIIGFIEPCRHPTIIDGMCAVCGKGFQSTFLTQVIEPPSASYSLPIPKKKLSKGIKSLLSDKLGNPTNNFTNSNSSDKTISSVASTTIKNIAPKNSTSHNLKPIFLNATARHNFETDGSGHVSSSSLHDTYQHHSTLSRVIVSGGITVNISQEEANNMTKESRNRLLNNKRLSLVLDLDHTLVHATNDTRAALEFDREDMRLILLPFSTYTTSSTSAAPLTITRHYVKMRPYLKEFLLGILDKYEASIYTAGTRAYAVQVVRAICRYAVGAMDEEELNFYKKCLKDVQAKIKSIEIHQQDQKHNREKQQGTQKSETHGIGVHDDIQILTEEASTAAQSQEAKVSISSNLKVVKEESVTASKKVSFSSKTEVFIIPEDTADSTSWNEQAVELQRKIQDAEALESKASELELKLFGSRVVSRCDVGDLGRDVKSVRRVFPCGGMMAAIIDDREDVWANASDNITSQGSVPGEPPTNLLLIKPYHFDKFRGFAEVNNQAGVDVTATQGKEQSESVTAENDEGLVYCNNILGRIHQRFYMHVTRDMSNALKKESDITVPQIIDQMRKEVLRGCTVVISGLIPLGEQPRSEKKGKARSPIVRYVEQLGGNITTDVNGNTTHVIAARTGTEKVFKGVRVRGCAIVSVDWLMLCYWSMSLIDVTPYLLLPIRVKETALEDQVGKPLKKGAYQQDLSIVNEKVPQGDVLLSNDAVSSDDESFAAELERSILTGNSEQKSDRASLLLLPEDDEESLDGKLSECNVQKKSVKEISDMPKRKSNDEQQRDSASMPSGGKAAVGLIQGNNKRLRKV